MRNFLPSIVLFCLLSISWNSWGQNGYGVFSFKEALQRANQGDAFAQAVVALHYQLGWETEKNVDLAAKFALASAKAGDPFGQFRLGALLRAGEGFAKDEQNGLAYQAASFEGLNQMTDNPYALTSLGILIFQGKAVWQNVPQKQRYQQAAELYRRAAERYFAPAMFNYAMCAEAGHGIPKNLGLRDAYVFDAAANQGYPPALGSLPHADHLRRIDETPDIGVLNRETKIWESQAEAGLSSRWHDLGATSGREDVKLEFRTDYVGWPVELEKESDYASRDLSSASQYIVEATEGGALIRPNSRGKLRFIEYPAALVFRIVNTGTNEPVEVMGIALEIVRWQPIDKVIPHVVTLIPESIGLHNYGWGESGPWQAEVRLFDRSSSGSNGSEAVILRNDSQATALYNPLALFKSDWAREMLREGLELPYLEFIQPIDGNSLVDSEAGIYSLGLSGADHLNPHIKLPAAVTLPAGRQGYEVTLAGHRMIEPGASAEFGISLDSMRSGEFDMRVSLVTSTGRVTWPATIHFVYECVRPYPGKAIYSAFLDPGNKGPDTFLEYQFGLMGEVFDVWSDSGLLTRKEVRARLSKLRNSILEKAKHAQGVRQLKPLWGAPESHLLPVLKSAADLSASDTVGDQVDGVSARIFGYRDSASYEGRLILDSGGAELYTANIPIPEGADESTPTTAQLVAHPQKRWVACLTKNVSGSRLSVVFPNASEASFSLPLLEEEKLVAIGLDKASDELIVFSETEPALSVNLDSALTYSALKCLESNTEINETDTDQAGRLLLIAAPINTYAGPASPTSITELQFIPRPAPKQRIQLSWIEPYRIGIAVDGVWRVCDLLRFRIAAASKSEANALSKDYEQKLARMKPLGSEGGYTVPGRDGADLAVVRGSMSSKLENAIRIGEIDIFANHNGVLSNGKQRPRRHISKSSGFAEDVAADPSGQFLVASESDGSRLFIVSLTHRLLVAEIFVPQGANEPILFTTPDGYFSCLNTGDVSVTDRTRLMSLAQFETKLNRPDLVLEKLGAPENLISEAKRLRERFLRRSDFKSFEGAALIDIPVVTVKTEVPEKTGDKSLTLDFEASNSTGPLKELRVFNNGALVQTVPLTGKDGQPSRESAGEVNVDLASGENRLQLMAVSEEGFTSAFAEKRVECTAEPDSRRCFIVAVGVSEYNDPRFNLKFAAKDAEDMSKALAEKAQHRGYQPEVMVVKNAEVDGALVGKLREFLSEAGTDDEVVLFFAGHGLLDKNLEYHFARHDTDFDATENMGITFQELESLVDGIKPLKRTVLFDTCHSGEVEEEDKQQLLAMVGGAAAPDAGSGVQVRGVATRGMKVKELEPKLRHADFIELESLFPDSRRAKGANILTSSSGSEFSMESDAWQNGLFTFAFLNALKDEKTDANGDKAVSFTEAAAAVQDKVKTLSGGQQRPITRGVNREAEVELASFGPPVQVMEHRKFENKAKPPSQAPTRTRKEVFPL